MTELADFRADKDQFFATPHSPIEDHHTFKGLSYYPESESLRFVLPVESSDGSDVVIGTSDGQTRTYQRAGVVRFVVNRSPVQLTLLSHDGGDGFFLPFRDATSGKTTYGAGRYLDVDPGANGKVSVDFNLAYNPYCAYSEAYSCPLPPTENWLAVPIEAGELEYGKATG